MRNLRLLLVLALTVAIAALVGCGGASSSGKAGGPSSGQGTTESAGITVIEKGFAFEPASLEVKVGDTVTFENQDSAPHNVKIDGKELGTQAQGASVTWTAEKAGSFPYTCTIHPAMAGEITVK